MLSRNRVVLGGTLSDLPALRYTPAGVAIQELAISHESQQQENGAERRVLATVKAVAVGQTGMALSRLKPGQALVVKGFLAAFSQRYPDRIVLHIDEYELLN
ncbi:primosomal replication protein N [Chitiniphilus eburneus]|uniref:Replication restart protein PriB n=1 Tax=Chitiniphilus eburneus TaxID=2571148 RepID=A0A4U0PZG8_9NEIS|nr:primosomal replication protein N [Chitiniphilus eburneus]TJZ74015.1 primosomal replication protein N [Chitiniphilus eburneus]